MMERSPFLPLPEGMIIGQIEITQSQLIVEVISILPCARCPGVGTSQTMSIVNISERFTTFPVRRPPYRPAAMVRKFLLDSDLPSESICRTAP